MAYYNYSSYLHYQCLLALYNLIRNLLLNVHRKILKCSERIKRRKIDSIINSHSASELTFAAASHSFKNGKRSAAILIKEVIENPNKTYKIKQNLRNDNNNNQSIPYTAIKEALAFFIDNDLTKKQYINNHISAKNRNCDMYPLYESIIEEKQKHYPTNMQISEHRCEISLQNLLDHGFTYIYLKLLKLKNIRRKY